MVPYKAGKQNPSNRGNSLGSDLENINVFHLILCVFRNLFSIKQIFSSPWFLVNEKDFASYFLLMINKVEWFYMNGEVFAMPLVWE